MVLTIYGCWQLEEYPDPLARVWPCKRTREASKKLYELFWRKSDVMTIRWYFIKKLYMRLFVCVCAAFTCVSHGVHLLQYVCQSQRTISAVSPHLPSCLRQDLTFAAHVACGRLTRVWASDFSDSVSCISVGALWWQNVGDVWSHTAHWESCEDLNSGLRAYLANSLLTEPPSQRQATFAEISWLSGQGCLCFYSIGDWTQGFVHRRCVP